MELICLNCSNAFDIGNADKEGGDGGVVCPNCGKVQRFKSHEETPIPAPSPMKKGLLDSDADLNVSGDSGAFKRPMQAFSSFARRTVAKKGELIDDTGEIPKARRTVRQDTTWEGIIPKVKKEEKQGGGSEEGEESTIWLVKSPSGLVLEFPTSQMLVNWSAIVEKPEPYSVSKGGKDWMALEEFLDSVRQGNRGTSAFRRAAAASGLEPITGGRDAGPSVARAVEGAGEVEDGYGDETGQSDKDFHEVETTSSPTSQFKFKIQESTKPKKNVWVVVAIVAGVLLLGAGGVVAMYFAGIL